MNTTTNPFAKKTEMTIALPQGFIMTVRRATDAGGELVKVRVSAPGDGTRAAFVEVRMMRQLGAHALTVMIKKIFSPTFASVASNREAFCGMMFDFIGAE